MTDNTKDNIIIISGFIILLSLLIGIARFVTNYAPDGKGGAIYQSLEFK